MTATTILNSIETAVKTHNLGKVQQENLKELISDYSDLFNEFKTLDETEIETLFKEVRKTRPLIGRRLLEQFQKDKSDLNTDGGSILF